MNLRYEKRKLAEGYSHIIGCDEVGRGCLAGPVVAAAVVLSKVESLSAFAKASADRQVYKVIKSAGIRDSKLLSQAQREKADAIIKQNFLWSIGVVSQEVVDKINIHNASLLAMRKAASGLLSGVIPAKAGILLSVDGRFKVPGLDFDQEAIIGGDNKVLSIAAASIIAKVYRDQLMKKLHKDYPIYNFAQHKGYATEHHRKMILRHGLSPLHRLTFCSQF